MRSNAASGSSCKPANASACTKRTSAPSRTALRRATASACGERSTAVTRASGISRARLTAMQPLPVPTSSAAVPATASAAAAATSSSVSGRGIRTPSPTSKVMPQNSVCASTYCTGRPAASWRTDSSRSGMSACASGATAYCVSVMPHRSKTKRRAICSASRGS